jgi:hypothetical protein
MLPFTRPGALVGIALIVGLVSTVLVIIGLGFVLAGKVPYRWVGPSYQSLRYAYVVDRQGTGIGSVCVELKDENDFNTLHRTFTDSTGRFELFSDAYAFMLTRFPAVFNAYVSLLGQSQVAHYSFARERFDFARFRKVSGPDTIVLDPHSSIGATELSLVHPTRIAADTAFGYQPWLESAMTNQPAALHGWRHVKCATLMVGDRFVAFAAMSEFAFDSSASAAAWYPCAGTATVHYVLDRNLDGSLSDETPRPWHLWNDSAGKLEADCDVRVCDAHDSIAIGNQVYYLDLQLSGIGKRCTSVSYRRSDALSGYLVVEDKPYRALLWDWGLSNYRDLKTVELAVDKNRDGLVERREGCAELSERLQGPLCIDTACYQIDQIYGYVTLLCHRTAKVSGNGDARIGSSQSDFSAFFPERVTLYSLCAENEYVLLYFFEGNTVGYMNSGLLSATLSVMRAKLGKTAALGVNRHAAGDHYAALPVIEENQGWSGPLVMKFHNHERAELICLNSSAEVVARGVPGKDFLRDLWEKAGKDDWPSAIWMYDRLFDGMVARQQGE